MKFILLTSLVLLVCVSGILVANGFRNGKSASAVNEESGAADVVRIYCLLASEGRYEEVTNYTAAPPREYFSLRDEMQEGNQNDTPSKTEKFTQRDPKQVIFLKDPGSDDAGNKGYSNLINDMIPRQLNKDAVYIREITRIRIKGDQASVVVAEGSRTNPNYGGKEEFLLVKHENNWQVFYVRYFIDSDPNYDAWPR